MRKLFWWFVLFVFMLSAGCRSQGGAPAASATLPGPAAQSPATGGPATSSPTTESAPVGNTAAATQAEVLTPTAGRTAAPGQGTGTTEAGGLTATPEASRTAAAGQVTPTAQPSETPRPSATRTAIASSAAPTRQGQAGAYHLAWSWQPESGSLVERIASTDRGMLLASDSTGMLHAFGPGGEARWSRVISYAGVSGPAVDISRRRIYTAAMPASLVAVDEDGEVVWTYEAAGEVRQTPFVSPSGEVYLRTYGQPGETGWVRLSGQGQELPFAWPESALPIAAEGQPAWLADGSLVAFSGRRVAVLAADGQELGACDLPATEVWVGLELRDDGGFFAMSREGLLAAYGGQCEQLWQLDPATLLPTATPPAEPNGATPAAAEDAMTETSLPQVAVRQDGVALVSDGQGRVYAINPQGGLVWQAHTDPSAGAIQAMVVGARGDLFLYAGRGYLQAIDKSGRLVWVEELFDAGKPGPLQPTSDGGVAVVQGGRLLVYSAELPPSAVRQPAAPAQDEATARQEILDYMLEHITREVIGWQGEPVKIVANPAPWELDQGGAGLLVFSPPSGGEEAEFIPVDQSRALEAWWFIDGTLYAVADPQRAIEEYRQRYIMNADGEPRRWMAVDFGMLKVSPDLRYGEVYLGYGCGPLCGAGYRLQLKRSLHGAWWLLNEVMVWISYAAGIEV